MSIVTGLGWALVHFLWQGALIGLLAGVSLLLSQNARIRYGVSCLAMVLMVLCFGVTVLVTTPRQMPGVQEVVLAQLGGAGGDGPIVRNATNLGSVLPWLVGLWLAGVFLLGLYRIGGWVMVRRMRRFGVCAATQVWQSKVSELARRMRVSKPVLLLESSLVEVPMVMGWLRPVLLMPVGLLAGMPVAQVEAILLHELAHVVRQDAIVNLLQTAIESVLFYHPSVWWTSRVMREEREKCCDDLVVALQGDAHSYALALLTLEERRTVQQELVMAANGGDLMNRVRRLMRQPEEQGGVAGLFVSVGILLSVFCVFAFAQAKQSPYDAWLKSDVVYIIEAREKATFEGLKSDEERTKFIEQFWLRRDPTSATPENEFKVEHYRRIAYANKKFASKVEGWKTDRGRVYILYGPPDELEKHPERNQEYWLYHQIPGKGANVKISFTNKNGEFVWDSDPHQ